MLLGILENMKIGIVTVYNSDNCGSFLQAFVLKSILEKENEVFFYELGLKNPIIDSVLSAGKNALKFRWGMALFIIKKIRKFIRCGRVFETCFIQEEVDMCILGSDEIWNINREKFSKAPVFWGEGINCKIMKSYAPSCNGADIDAIRKHKPAIALIDKADLLSVRDEYTAMCLNAMTNKKIVRVLDPTFLIPASKYKLFEKEVGFNNFILLYTSTASLSKYIEEIKSFANREGLKLISINQKYDWCDYSYPASPYEFLNFYRKASYVITDTFHGTAFSITYNKKFVVIGRSKNKVVDLLKYFGLEMNDIEKGASLETILYSDINWEKINDFIACNREESLDFLLKMK